MQGVGTRWPRPGLLELWRRNLDHLVLCIRAANESVGSFAFQRRRRRLGSYMLEERFGRREIGGRREARAAAGVGDVLLFSALGFALCHLVVLNRTTRNRWLLGVYRASCDVVGHMYVHNM